MELKGKRVGFALTGSYCTFSQVFPVIEDIAAMDADIVPIVSENVSKTDTRFGTAVEHLSKLKAITGKEVIKSIVESEPIGPKKLLDILVIAPCTGNTLAKIAYGICDSSVSMAVKSHLRNNRPVLIAISSNDGLSTASKNIGQLLCRKNIYFVPFGQDNPIEKPTSLVAKMNFIIPSIETALEGRQFQEILK